MMPGSTSDAILMEEGASHIFDHLAVGGMLTLHPDRVVFKATPGHRRFHSTELFLRDIAEINFFQTLNISPNGLLLSLRNGAIEHFIVDDRGKWKTRLSALLSGVRSGQ